eukprot:TRINITY_DN1988_c0_g1_i9.p1 TRINITY_DN1988_c0_g1~~TRINITY_DN1988_c0_g1_i9.p1  ORF type:complete len:524 (+),score=210.18 TRINITY_DN1988_c0_g1_i9:55-1626(+)
MLRAASGPGRALRAALGRRRVQLRPFAAAVDRLSVASEGVGPPTDSGSAGGGDGDSGAAGAAPAAGGDADEGIVIDLEEAVVARALPPVDIVNELDKYIIGQENAKRAVAVSLRNRWRRTRVKDADLRDDIHPKNILMIGPTGVGKTEISRRMSKLTDAPFVKVEATKFTEVGFRGRDVDTIVEELYTASVSCAKRIVREQNLGRAKAAARKIVLSKLVTKDAPEEMQKYGELLDKGELDSNEIEYVVQHSYDGPKRDRMRMPLRVDTGDEKFQGMMMLVPPDDKSKYMRRSKGPVKEAMPLIIKDELEKMVNQQQVTQHALKLAENHGVVFIDEIDKVVVAGRKSDADASDVGVQQDLLPLIEGCTVTLKDGTAVKTDNVLFICSGAFHSAKPSDMIAELQGRLPVRVELDSLAEGDFYRILTEPKFNIIRQNQELLRTEGVELEFTPEALRQIAKLTQEVNSEMQNIGARRLITVVEKIVEDISYVAEDYKHKKVTVDVEYVNAKVEELRKDQKDIRRSIL